MNCWNAWTLIGDVKDFSFVVFSSEDRGDEKMPELSRPNSDQPHAVPKLKWFGPAHTIRFYAAVNVNPVPSLVRRSTLSWHLAKKVVAQNSILIHPGPQVNLSDIHSFSHQFSTLSKPFSIRYDENLARYSRPIIFLNDRNSTYIISYHYTAS
jgi:hypothetical protein